MSPIISRPLFLFGNGLSMALSPEFSLRKITKTFIENLDGLEKAYLTELCGGEDKLDFDDFERNFSLLEDAYGSLRKYRMFIESETGQAFLENFSLEDPQLYKHENIIKSIYNKYIFQILELIQGNVTKKGIAEKLGGFTSFLKRELGSCGKGYVFTLNYDLLAETILLEEIGTDSMTDFCSSAGPFKGTSIAKFDFDPAMSEDRLGEDYAGDRVELQHLHGSLSLFYDYARRKAIKFRSDDIFANDVYKRIHEEEWTLHPAIITGGGKSLKMIEYPFEFYFRNFKDITTYGKCSKLYIVGYSFRDDHVNELIKKWMSKMERFEDGLLIIDFKSSEEDKNEFKRFVNKQLKKRISIPDKCFEFGGANKIHTVLGTKPKPKLPPTGSTRSFRGR